MNTDFDVVIMGGGLAGLSLAIQIKDARPETSILVADKHRHPVPEAAFKVGESSSESGTHYFANVIGMKAHMEAQQLSKLGLRFIFTDGDNRDIATRPECGPTFLPIIPGFQLDRGRFENHLAGECRARGVELREAVSIREVSIDKRGAPHTVSIQQDGKLVTVAARWVIDAAGRSGMLRRQLGLDHPVGHGANASWFRVADVIEVDSWSDEPAWRARFSNPPRSLSTTHLMGRGYWVWLIRLSSGSTSVGIVADPAFHPIDKINTFDRCREWLRLHEPQCSDAVESRLDKVQDFLTLKGFAHGAKRVYSHHRWALAGDAGPFTDPLYSPGSDFIGFGNSYITDLVVREMAGENIVRRVALFDLQYLGTYESFLSLYEGRYPLMGNAQIMIAKVIWDYAAYWSSIAQLFFRRKLIDATFMRSNLALWHPVLLLNRAMQDFFSAWDRFEHTNWQPGYVDTSSVPFLYNNLHSNLGVDGDDTEVRRRLQSNAELLNRIGVEFARHAIGTLEDVTRTPSERSTTLIAALPGRIRELYLRGESYPEVAADLRQIWLQEKAAASARA